MLGETYFLEYIFVYLCYFSITILCSHISSYFSIFPNFSCFSRFSLSAGNPEQAKKTALCKECQMSISYREESLHPNTGKNPKTNTYKHKHAQTLNTDKYKKNNKIEYLYSGKRQTILNSFSLNFRISCFIQKKIFQQNTVLKVLEMSKYIKP